MNIQDSRVCWCGSAELVAFSPGYRRCKVCQTLVVHNGPTAEQLLVKDDESDFYGKQYWLGHQKQDLGFADINDRSRSDLIERNLHWLETLLKFCLPPANLLELGSAHGSFLAVAREAGYRVAGVEMSPWVVEFAEKTFGVPVSLGPVESLNLQPGTLHVIVLMDVLEHLPDPVTTMKCCLDLLKPDGLLLIQTPQFRETIDHGTLLESKDRFLDMLVPDEHIFLFSKNAVTTLFRRLEANYIQFEPALFAEYDMFFVVGRGPLRTNSLEEVEAALLRTSEGRLALAKLDLRKRELKLNADLRLANIDRAARAEQIKTLTALLHDSEADRFARASQIDILNKLLAESEADRNARNLQIASLTSVVQESEADRAARNVQIASLTALVHESEADRAARGTQIATLTSLLEESEADRSARFKQIETLTALINGERVEDNQQSNPANDKP